ncbi:MULTISPECIES: hypothetical protein [unclassified Streptomyces]|uniref:hypothetical protein n=1 Tax=unclassified Streptomyces TaxID=2593676 RepID=UPI00166033C3|nr:MULTISPECIES: hypothetical protein [unclassified Streptomyces]MBD0710910.1 hypothetical protein [Streptomyces sp. CBMA291]MBD0717329.1 hypothetical protein [Streptomyces sp. CBMA370]
MSDPAPASNGQCSERTLEDVLALAHGALRVAVRDRLSAQGGLPELRDPDLALSRTLARMHRALGTSVSPRLTRPPGPDREGAPAGHLESGLLSLSHPLADRLAPVRIKYRHHALQTALSYGITDLMPTLAGARRITENVIGLLEFEDNDLQVRASVQRLEKLLEQVENLVEEPPATTKPTPPDYLSAVRQSLEVHARPLLRAVHDAHRLLREELVPMLAEPDSAMDSEMLTRDLSDDLDQAWAKAHDLSGAVKAVQKASNDFVGQDLRQANLEGARLAGVRWDASTTWPEEWEPLIRRASAPVDEEPGVLVIAAEPSTTRVPADT